MNPLEISSGAGRLRSGRGSRTSGSALISVDDGLRGRGRRRRLAGVDAREQRVEVRRGSTPRRRVVAGGLAERVEAADERLLGDADRARVVSGREMIV